MKAHCPTDQPNEPHANVNIAGVDHPEVVDAMTNEYVAFYGHESQSHLGRQEETTQCTELCDAPASMDLSLLTHHRRQYETGSYKTHPNTTS